jgi:hypothetical protein
MCAQNLLSPGTEEWNIWRVKFYGQSWVKIDFDGMISFQGIGFKSAGDTPQRDPSEVKVSIYLTAKKEWQQIAVL